MNQEIKTRWVNALRSGLFEQGQGTLRTQNEDGPDGMCCLGVLCELAVLDGVVERQEFLPNSYTYGEVGNDAFLPDEVQKWAGVDSEAPLAGEHSLAYYNDVGRSFTEIADLIEEHL